MHKFVNRNIIIAALLIAGLSILFYPVISNKVNQYKADKSIEQYKKNVKLAGRNSNAEELKKAYNYNKSLVGQVPPGTFSERQDIRNDKGYEQLLNNGEKGMMGWIEIPSIDVKLPIYHYTTKEILEKGAGHLFGSSLPVGGRSTHSVITAHRGLPGAIMFTNLDLMKKKDLIHVYVEEKKMAYAVDQVKTVKPEDCSDLGIEKNKDLITLVTCTPYGKNTERLLVRGQRTEFPGKKTSRHYRLPLMHIVYAILGVLLAMFVIQLLRRIRR